jgi:hypothetical protein
MKLKSAVIAAALAVASASSFATSFSFDGSMEMSFLFPVSTTSSIDAAVTSSVVDGYGFDITAVTFDGTPFGAFTLTTGNTTVDFYSFSAPSISAGTHSIEVFGTALGSTYDGNVVLTPVPEPETYALMLAGLGVGGFLFRRRRND